MSAPALVATPPIVGAAPAPVAVPQVATAPVKRVFRDKSNHYSASNGKWTIGGLSRTNVMNLISHNGVG